MKSGSGTDYPRMQWHIADVLDATGGEVLMTENCQMKSDNMPQSNSVFAGISIDSRTVVPDEIFAAVKGNVHDGHGFIGDVVKKGVRGIIVAKDKAGELPCAELKGKNIICFAVKDTVKALGDLATYNRKRSKIPLTAVTGSNGKTTTRRMTVSVLSRKFRTLTAYSNYNNEIGVPLTLLNLSAEHEQAVLELGMNHPGEIGRLGEICMPDIGVITNIGPAHLEFLGSLDGVMRAKGELLEKIKPEGTAVLNGDDPRCLSLASETDRNVLLFGFGGNCHIRAEMAEDVCPAGNCFTLALPGGERVPVSLKIPGRFMVYNALAAAAAGFVLGLSADDIKSGLENYVPAPGRMNIIKTDKGAFIVDDTYNANPGSVEAAIEALRSLKQLARGIFVAGDMLELGEHSLAMHRKIGRLAAASGIGKLFITGRFAENVASGARESGMSSRDIFIGNKTDIIETLKNMLGAGDWVLVKGSRGMGMEDVVKGLTDRGTES